MKRIFTLMIICFSLNSWAIKIKMATLIPTGTNWSKTLKNMGKEIKKETKGKVKLQFYYGGVQGPIKIWEINHQDNIIARQEFLNTSGEYAEYDNLDFIK